MGNEIAKAIVETGVEGGFDNVCSSTAGDKICIGISSWENERASEILSMIDGGSYYDNRTYSDIVNAGEKETLSELLNSEQGQEAQLQILSRDCEDYAQSVIDAGLTDARTVIYAGVWCPTSTYIVSLFIKNRINRGYDIKTNLDNLYKVFYDEYTDAAGVGEQYREGYQNRATNTYNYVKDLDLSAYGYWGGVSEW